MKKDRIVLTKEKSEALIEELNELVNNKRKELGKTLEQARLSDVSEDTDSVIVVMNEIEKVDKKIKEIEETLENSVILDKKGCKGNKIAIGSEVTVKVNDKKAKYTIVSEIEVDTLQNKISGNSPLGKELLKSKIGDTLVISINGKKMKYEIIEVC